MVLSVCSQVGPNGTSVMVGAKITKTKTWKKYESPHISTKYQLDFNRAKCFIVELCICSTFFKLSNCLNCWSQWSAVTALVPSSFDDNTETGLEAESGKL